MKDTNHTSSGNQLIAKNTLFLYIRALMILFASLYSSRVLLQALGVSDFGIYNVVAGFVSMFGFLNTVMVNSVQRFLNTAIGKQDYKEYNFVINNALLVQIILAIFVLLLTETVGLWFVNNKLNIPFERKDIAEFVYHVVVCSFVVKIIQAPFTAIVISKERMSLYSVQGILEAVLLLGITFIIKEASVDKLQLYAVLLLLVTLVIFMANILFAKISYPEIKVRLSHDKTSLTNMLSFAGWNLIGSMSNLLKSQGINILLNMFFSVVVNAARGIACQVLGGVSSMVGNFQTALNPQLIQSYAERNYSRYESLVFFGSKISFLLMWFMVLPLVLCMDEVLEIWLGEDFVPEYTALFTVIILFTGLIDSLASIIATGVYAIGNMKAYQVIVSSITLLILPISYIVLKLGLGPESAMYASLFVGIIAQYIRVVIWTKLSGCSIKKYLKYVILPLIMVMVVSYVLASLFVQYITVSNNLLHITCIVLLTIPLNIFCIYLMGVNKSERNLVNKYICAFWGKIKN